MLIKSRDFPQNAVIMNDKVRLLQVKNRLPAPIRYINLDQLQSDRDFVLKGFLIPFLLSGTQEGSTPAWPEEQSEAKERQPLPF
jgi:hypothetical protein